jgi:hypothetical protein
MPPLRGGPSLSQPSLSRPPPRPDGRERASRQHHGRIVVGPRPYDSLAHPGPPSSPVRRGGGREKRAGVMRANLPGTPTLTSAAPRALGASFPRFRIIRGGLRAVRRALRAAFPVDRAPFPPLRAIRRGRRAARSPLRTAFPPPRIAFPRRRAPFPPLRVLRSRGNAARAGGNAIRRVLRMTFPERRMVSTTGNAMRAPGNGIRAPSESSEKEGMPRQIQKKNHKDSILPVFTLFGPDR